MSDSAREVAVALRSSWWVPLVRGIVLLVLGFLMLAHPFDTVVALVWIWGIFAILDGLLSLGQWIANRRDEGSIWWLVLGLVGIAFGLVAVIWAPGATKTIFYLVAIWVLVLGVLGCIAAATLYRARDVAWYWVLATGLIAFLFGLLMLVNPQGSFTVLVMLLGMFAFASGVLLVVSAFAAKTAAKQLGQGTAVV